MMGGRGRAGGDAGEGGRKEEGGRGRKVVVERGEIGWTEAVKGLGARDGSVLASDYSVYRNT